jgi:hypothetical protein
LFKEDSHEKSCRQYPELKQFKTVAVLYVGKPKNGVDAISSPTVRENARDTKVYIKRFRR